MSRSGYVDDIDQWELNLWSGAVKRAIRGKRGQKFLAELLAALDAMPNKRLIQEELQNAEGEVCALGSLGVRRKMPLSKLDLDDYESVAAAFGVAEALVREIEYQNDESIAEWRHIRVEFCGPMRPSYPDWGKHTQSVRVPVRNAAERRWHHMREWVASHLDAIGI